MPAVILAFTLIVLLFSIIIHEIAHGSMAYYLGDPTAKYEGRLTLNPLKHLDLFGSILLPLFLWLSGLQIFAWAKPVPINPFNFRDQKWGRLKVSLAGPLSNFLIAIIFSLSIRFLPLSEPLLLFFTIIALYNFAWGIFNLVPIPPLDGFHILDSILSYRLAAVSQFLRRYGLIILIVFLMSGGVNLVFDGAEFFYRLVIGV